MIEALWATLALLTLIGLPLTCRIALDSARTRASGVRAVISSAVRSAVGGDSWLAIEVTPCTIAHPGRVILSAPSDWEEVLLLGLRQAMDRVPAPYEIVIRVGAPSRQSGTDARHPLVAKTHGLPAHPFFPETYGERR